jgi:quinol monooxygenase YgiN
MAGVVHIPWYATILRHEAFAEAVALQAAPTVLRYGATQYAVHRSRDDRYRILQMAWFEDKGDWYRYWEGPEMIEFRRRHSGRYQIPVAYIWHDELAAGALGPEVPLGLAPEPEPEPVPPAAA